VKSTRYFLATRQRPDRVMIRDEWIQRVIDHPVKETIQQDGRIRRWAPIAEMDGKFFAGYTASRWGNRAQRIL
jgi:hypothetical protein